MKLYHFCPAHMVAGIRQNGLTLGKFPILSNVKPTFIGGLQWLTSDPDPDKQSWATNISIPYSRTAYRLTIDIPRSGMRRLVKATEFVKGLAPANRGIVDDWPGSESWYIYRGAIPAKWIERAEEMEP